jgi:hypothetical protein
VNSYGFFFDLAQNIAAGNGITFGDGPPTAFLVQLYPVFLAAITFGQKAFLPIVLAQASARGRFGLMALAVLLLLRACRNGSGMMAVDLTLGAAVLTRDNLAPFALLVPLWLVVPAQCPVTPWRQRWWTGSHLG